VTVTWAVLAAYALGMPASAASRVLSSTFYALRDTRTPARIAYVRVVLSLGAGFALMFPMDGFTVDSLRLGASGLALGASIAAWTEFALLRRALQRSIGAHGMGGGRLVRLLLAGALGAGTGVLSLLIIPDVHPWLRALGTLVPFGSVYLMFTVLFGVSQPLRDLRSPSRFAR